MKLLGKDCRRLTTTLCFGIWALQLMFINAPSITILSATVSQLLPSEKAVNPMLIWGPRKEADLKVSRRLIPDLSGIGYGARKLQCVYMCVNTYRYIYIDIYIYTYVRVCLSVYIYIRI